MESLDLLAARRLTLAAALGFALLPALEPELGTLHGWLDTWRGIGDVVVGMARQDYDIQLTRYDGRGWRATFYTSGMEHSATSAIGSAWESTPWRAVQRPARDALAADPAFT
jgi:hypothetical protein